MSAGDVMLGLYQCKSGWGYTAIRVFSVQFSENKL